MPQVSFYQRGMQIPEAGCQFQCQFPSKPVSSHVVESQREEGKEWGNISSYGERFHVLIGNACLEIERSIHTERRSWKRWYHTSHWLTGAEQMLHDTWQSPGLWAFVTYQWQAWRDMCEFAYNLRGMFSAIFNHLLVGKKALGNPETLPQMSTPRKEEPSGLSPRH